MTCPYCHHEHDKDFGCKPYVDKVALGLCMRPGCDNKLKSKRARFCSGACKVAAHRKKTIKGRVVPWSGVRRQADPAIETPAQKMIRTGHHSECRKPDACLLTPKECRESPSPGPLSEDALEIVRPGVVQVARGVVVTPSVFEETKDQHSLIEETCPPDCDLKESHIHVSMPRFATAKPKTKPMGWLMSSGSIKPLDRSHAPGCPCWTCKGIPTKKPSPKKP